MNLIVKSCLINNQAQLTSLFSENLFLTNSNFFLSENWLTVWLAHLPFPPILVTVLDNQNNLVGAAIFCFSKLKKAGIFSHKKFFLNATGQRVRDQIWIEYNDCFYLPEHENAVKRALMHFIFDTLEANEIIIGTSSNLQLTAWQTASPYQLQSSLFESQGYLVNLLKLRKGNQEYKDVLSKNTRYQINRSLKAFEAEFGKLTLIIATTAHEALHFFDSTASWHKHRWQQSVEGSGFDNPYFVNFHRSLIENAFAQQQIQYIKVVAGEHVLGYLYCFLYANKVYFYLSSINYAVEDNKFKPGVLMHFLAIQHFEQQGVDSYDFLGGEARYKQSLSTETYQMSMLSFRKPSLLFAIEDKLRKLKKYCKKLGLNQPQ